jgi:ribosomal protein S18 acetylase RimI-like enzyme
MLKEHWILSKETKDSTEFNHAEYAPFSELCMELCKCANGFVYKILDSSLAEESAFVELEAFVDEPSRDSWEHFISYFTKECSSNGLSVIAVDETNGKIAGCMWNRDAAIELNPGVWEIPPPLGNTLEALVEVERKFSESHSNGLANGEVFELWMLAVAPHYRKNGIAAVLIETSLELARSKGFSKAVVEATGEFSYKSILKFGFKVIK